MGHHADRHEPRCKRDVHVECEAANVDVRGDEPLATNGYPVTAEVRKPWKKDGAWLVDPRSRFHH